MCLCVHESVCVCVCVCVCVWTVSTVYNSVVALTEIETVELVVIFIIGREVRVELIAWQRNTDQMTT